MVILFPRTCGRSLCIYLSARISVSFMFYTLRLFNNTIYIARKRGCRTKIVRQPLNLPA